MSEWPPVSPWRRRIRLFVLGSLGLTAFVAAVVTIKLRSMYVVERDKAIAVAEQHRTYQVAHAGWSFPAHIWSDSADIADMTPARVTLHATAREYEAVCPPTKAGEFCKKTGEVILRGGHFPEGDQPPGNDGWTRPLAFEPMLLAEWVGPDAEVREHLPLERAPKALISAILAAEDEDFYSHGGVDFPGLLRAVSVNVSGRGYQQGASTLTMQVVRNLTQDKQKSMGRKFREIVQARVVDGYLGKDGVMQMYLDAPYLGQDGPLSVCGFQAAAKYYWGVDVEHASIAQLATLAAILPAPGNYGPDRTPEIAKTRRDRVLTRMAALGWDQAEIDAAIATPMTVDLHSTVPPEKFPAYLQATRAELEAKLPPETLYGAGLDVFTGLDVAAQASSEKLLGERRTYLERTTGVRGDGPLRTATALVSPTTGALVAIYDSGLDDSKGFNRATQARRQAGSSFKPMVYALGFSPGDDGKPKFRADSKVVNTPHKFEGTDGWSPRNVGGRYTATSCLAYGLAESQNIATASLLAEAGGPDALVALASKFGFDTRKFPHEMGISLGQAEVTPLEMARFVATVIGGGRKLSASPVLRAVDPTGAVRIAIEPPGEPVLTPDAALMTRELMELVVLFGTGGSVKGGGGFPGFDGPIVGKTGTADDEKDLWFVGGTPSYAGALWLGYDHPVRIGGSASDLAAPMFGWWMRAVHEGLPRQKFDTSQIHYAWVCTQTGRSPVEGCKGIRAPFLEGTGPVGACSGTHAPETGEPMEEHMSLWKKMAAAAEARALEEAGGDTDTDSAPAEPQD